MMKIKTFQINLTISTLLKISMNQLIRLLPAIIHLKTLKLGAKKMKMIRKIMKQ